MGFGWVSVVLQGIAQIPVGKVLKNNKGTCVLMYAFFLHGIAHIPVGKAQSLVQNELKFSYSDENNKGTCVFMYVVLHGTAQIPVGKAQNQKKELKFSYSD